MIAPEQVTLAYQLLLGRNPENEAVVQSLCETVHSVADMRKHFIESAEFRKRMGETLDKLQNVQLGHPFNLPRIPVDVQITDENLKNFFNRIKQEWTHLGETEPYWSTITQPQYKKDKFSSNQDQFYKSGKYAVDTFMATLRRNNINPHLLQSVLELGCSVGRISLHLAEHFKNIVASDISLPLINIAKEYFSSKNITNVSFFHFDDPRFLYQLPNFDAIFSIITLQHNPPPLISWTLQNLIACLNPGGIAYVQIPTYRNGYIFEVERYLKSPKPETLEMHFLPQYEIFKIIELGNCLCLEVREDGMVGSDSQMLSNTFLIQKKLSD